MSMPTQMQDPWSPAGPPPPPPPAGGGKSRKPMVVVGAVAAALVVAGGVTGGVLALTGGKAHPTPQSSPTTQPSSTPTTAPSLVDSVPSAFKSDCQALQSKDFWDITVQSQVLCVGASIPNAQGVAYLQYGNSNESENYYSGTLLQSNGMQSGAGACNTLDLSGTATNGSYCETDIQDTQGGPTTGHNFVFYGTSFNLGTGADIANLCQTGSKGFTVVGWTDDPTNLTAVAVSCTSDVATAQSMESDYLHSQYDLTSTP